MCNTVLVATLSTGNYSECEISHPCVKDTFTVVGFSFGGLLACAVAACVWDTPYISSSLLMENLVCITFAQPNVPVPFLPEVAREHPELISTIHTVYWEEDLVPRLSRFLNECCSSLRDGAEDSRSGIKLKMQEHQKLVRMVVI